MTKKPDQNPTVDLSSASADSLDAGLAVGFGRKAEAPRSSLGDLRPLLLKEAEGESSHVVKPNSDAMPQKSESGDRYQLSGEIARGGMGAILRGRDVDLGRDLAVKVLLEKYAHRPEVARRFIEEAQIGGQLQHPGVVPVYDIGRFGDRPFFTMKLVKGKTLAAILAERSDSSAERPRLLGIALQVTQTLAYAHAKGVIHRDLKPANIMVGAFGEVQVMDWGLAKVLAEGGIADEERASRAQQAPEDVTTIRTARSAGSTGSFGTDTEAGSLLGTPAYMPPEQANGDVALLDRRADVFGIGGILCEILTGSAPYVGRSSEEVRRKAANGDLADAHARLGACGADQELIDLTKQCLAPEAIDRPKDAQEVAESLVAYLDGVQARLHKAELAEVEARATAIEEVKRRRLTLALASTVLLALTLGGGSWLWIRAARDARMAQVTRDVNEALNKATALREQAKVATVGSAALFSQAREQTQRALALVQSGPADASLAQQVASLQTELDEEQKDRQLIAALEEARLAATDISTDGTRFSYGAPVPLFREALRAYGLPVGAGDPMRAVERIRQRPAAVREVIFACLEDWDSLLSSATLGVKEPHREWMHTVLEAGEPEDTWGRQIRTAITEKDLEKRRARLENLAVSVNIRKVPSATLIRLARQLAPAQKIELLRRAQAHYPADFFVNFILGTSLDGGTQPEYTEAVRFLTAAVALQPDCSAAHSNLGLALQHKGQLDEAIACYHKAIELDPKLAGVHNNLGNALKGKGELDEAIVSHRKAIELDPKFADAHNSLGIALKTKGQVDEAIACYLKAIELDPKFAKAHYNLGIALNEKGKLDEASVCYRKAIELDPKDAKAHNNLGAVLLGKGQLDDAIACFRKSMELDPTYAMAHYNLGNALRIKGRLDETIACYRKAIELDPKYAPAHGNLGVALNAKGQFDEAIACYRKVIELDPKDAKAHNYLGAVLLSKGQLDEAIACYNKAIELDPTYMSARTGLANANRMARGRDKLSSYQDGSYTPANSDEYLGLAEWCQFKKLNHTAAGLYASAFAADPKLADDLQVQHRYNASCHAALAAAGQGEDAAKLDEAERTRLRKQALEWLRADLGAYSKQIESANTQAVRTFVLQRVTHWRQDGDLASIRDEATLAKLPPDEREAFTQLWADVEALLKKAEIPAAKVGQP